jgi:hypothetical protein
MKHCKSYNRLRKSKNSKSRNNRRRRTYRQYSGGARAGTSAAVEIKAIDAAFNAAVGRANLTREHVKAALVAHQKSVPELSSEAKRHMVALMNSLNEYSPTTVITPALLATSAAREKAKRDTAVAADVAFRSTHQPRLLGSPLTHSGNPKVNPASPRRPSSP